MATFFLNFSTLKNSKLDHISMSFGHLSCSRGAARPRNESEKSQILSNLCYANFLMLFIGKCSIPAVRCSLFCFKGAGLNWDIAFLDDVLLRAFSLGTPQTGLEDYLADVLAMFWQCFDDVLAVFWGGFGLLGF